MKQFNHWTDIPNLRLPFLGINITNKKLESQLENRRLFALNKTGHWPIKKVAIDHGLENQTILLLYNQGSSAVLYSGTCHKVEISAYTKKNDPRYTLTSKKPWKPLGEVHVSFSRFFEGFPIGGNPVAIWFDDKTGQSSSKIEADLQRDINASTKLSRADRLERLKIAPRLPRKINVMTTVFNRNPHVIVEVRERAQGRCEACLKPAPFLRRGDNLPYLEVHHRIPLADGGEDTIENAIALCPNCHRRAHFG